LFFASTTGPYAEKSHAGLVATACDLRADVHTTDFAGSTKAATGALRAALDACRAGSAKAAVITAADCRNAYPKSADESLLGDASAAVAVGSTGVLATVDCFVSLTNEITDVWRLEGERYIHSAEGRFREEYGYRKEMLKAVEGLLGKIGADIGQFAKVILTASGLKDHLSLAKKLGLDAGRLQEPFVGDMGYPGVAQPLLLLAEAIAHSQPGDRLLLAAYGNGADAFALTVTDEVKKLSSYKGVEYFLGKRQELDCYAKFLSFRDLLTADPGQPYNIKASTAAEWREQNTFIKLYGSTCNQCGTSIFPANRVCDHCGAKDDFKTFRGADRIASIFTYSLDNYAGRSDFPLVGQIVADDETGARFYLNMTDFRQEDIQIGEKVEFTLRKIHELGGYVNYYWKCRPLRTKEGK
jgi:3-hydroxy-3-methylglutaryl CoA synthase